MKKTQLAALFFISAAGIAFELYVMRIFSVGSWSNFGSLVISTALLGIGLAGIILTFVEESIQKRPEMYLSILSIALPVFMTASVILAQKVPFNPIFLASDTRQLWFIGAYYIIYGFPFFIIAAYVGITFIALRDKIQGVYFWNMLGSGLGGLFIVLFMFFLPPHYLLLPILALTILAALLTCCRYNEKWMSPIPKPPEETAKADNRQTDTNSGADSIASTEAAQADNQHIDTNSGADSIASTETEQAGSQQNTADSDSLPGVPTEVEQANRQYRGKWLFPLPYAIFLALSTIFSIIFTFFWGNIRISDYKDISYVRRYADSSLVHHSYGPAGEFHVYASKYFHFAPGLSDNAVLKIENLPSQLYWGLFIDGSGPIGIMGNLLEQEKIYMDFLPMTAPYTMITDPNVLLVNLSGGINAQVALYNGARNIDIVEPSYEMIRLFKNDPTVSPFTGRLLDTDKINVIRGEGRSHCANNENTYDLIEISLVDSVGLTDSGGYTVHEDFKYTVEAFKEYFSGLKEGGVLSVTVWDRLNPPRNVPRLLNTIIKAMRESGFEEPEKSLYSFGLLRSTSTILVKKGPLTTRNVNDLNRFIKDCSFELFYAPGAELPLRDLDILLASYRYQFEDSSSDDSVETFTNADMYRTVIPRFFAGEAEKIETDYIFDIRPILDSRPYYTGFLKMEEIDMYLDQLRDISEEWGYLLLFAMLIQACLFGIIVILLPVIGRWKTLFKKRRGTIGVILYYAGLGLGYMLIEIYLIQRLAVFLSNPTYSTSIVITVMLVSSALGNITSSLLKRFRLAVVPIACVLVGGGLLFYIFGLDSFLAAFHASSMMTRFLIAALVIAPPAFFMGIPYPNGLDSLQETKPHLLPWAWGMNGGLSLVGSALARLLSVSRGFPVLLQIGIGIYLLVGLLFPINYKLTRD
jgi:spermidine synthase